jgi:hypothetical protein
MRLQRWTPQDKPTCSVRIVRHGGEGQTVSTNAECVKAKSIGLSLLLSGDFIVELRTNPSAADDGENRRDRDEQEFTKNWITGNARTLGREWVGVGLELRVIVT